MGVPRCKKGTYTEKKQQGQVLLQAGPNLPCPGIPQQAFLPPGLRGSPTLQLLGNLPRMGRTENPTQGPSAQCQKVPMVSHNQCQGWGQS